MIPVSESRASSHVLQVRQTASYRGIRVLAWDGDVLYGCRGYQLHCLNLRFNALPVAEWQLVASYDPAWWRSLTSRAIITQRLVRDGFHALAILQAKDDERTASQTKHPTIIAAVPGAIVTRTPASNRFRATHKIRRGTRPLHITAVADGTIYWGEYFDNRERAEVHIYASSDRGETWHIAHTFRAGAIRHVHNIIYDRWADCLWILTGDEGSECKILRASCNLRCVEEVLSGNQQARAVAAVPTPDALYLSTDTPFEKNHVLRMDRGGKVDSIADLESSSIFGCRVGNAIFFTTMVEPSSVNRSREVHLVGSGDQVEWKLLGRWKKDMVSMRYFQYGNAILPDGYNSTNYLAATTIAVQDADLVTTVWEVESPACAQPQGSLRV